MKTGSRSPTSRQSGASRARNGDAPTRSMRVRVRHAVRRRELAPERSCRLAGLPAFEELVPVPLVEVDAETPRGRLDAPPRLLALSVRHTLHLVEASDRVAHVGRVGEGFIALFGERERVVCEPVLFAGRHPWRASRDAVPAPPLCLGGSRLLEIASSR